MPTIRPVDTREKTVPCVLWQKIELETEMDRQDGYVF